MEFRYNLGNGPAVLRSLKKVILGMWHSVNVKRYHKDSVLVMDNDPEVLGSVHGDLKSLDLSSSTYIGNVPNILDQASFNMGTSRGLVGCIRRLKLGHRNIRFHFDHEPVFKSAFQISECNDKLCQDVTCYNQVKCRHSKKLSQVLNLFHTFMGLFGGQGGVQIYKTCWF